MLNSVKQELTQHIQDLIIDEVLTLDNVDDWHFHAFNEDYYIIGYYQAEQWLKNHDIGVFEALETVHDYEKENFGETGAYTDAEKLVNMYIYVLGGELLSEIQEDLIEELENN